MLKPETRLLAAAVSEGGMRAEREVDVAQPFLKYAGGKRQLLPEIRKYVPKKFGRYFEPFVGGGAVFFDLVAAGRIGQHVAPPGAVLGDKNQELMTTYGAVKVEVEKVCAQLRHHAVLHSESHYYGVRARPYDAKGSAAYVGARMIYLNRTAFNGLYRVNRAGEFNVPFGRYTNPTICDKENLLACSRALRIAKLESGDFEVIVALADRGDFVYFDPPYCPVSTTSNFTSYTRDGFTLDDQKRLAECARALKKRGVHVLLSNADVPIVRKLYKGFELHRVSARRNINSKGEKRGNVGELLIVGSPSR